MLNIRLPFVNRLEQVFKTYIQMQSHQEKIIGDSVGKTHQDSKFEIWKKWTCGLINDPLDKWEFEIDHNFTKFTTRQQYLDNQM